MLNHIMITLRNIAKRMPVLVLHFVFQFMLFTSNVTAADTDKRVEQFREMARRSQQDLQRVQAELTVTKQQYLSLTQERDALLIKLESKEKSNLELRSALQAAKSLTQQVTLQRDQLQDAEAERTQKIVATERRYENAVLEAGNERKMMLQSKATLSAVLALLERTHKALLQAELSNRKLKQLGLDAVEAWAKETPVAMRSRTDPFGGYEGVQLEDQAEGIRLEMSKHYIAQ